MSDVTNIILIAPHEFEKCIKALNDFLSPYSLVSPDSTGGGKNIEAEVYTGAYNDINISEFRFLFKELDWGDSADLVQLLYKCQEDEIFHLEFADGRIVC